MQALRCDINTDFRVAKFNCCMHLVPCKLSRLFIQGLLYFPSFLMRTLGLKSTGLHALCRICEGSSC